MELKHLLKRPERSCLSPFPLDHLKAREGTIYEERFLLQDPGSTEALILDFRASQD